MPIIQAVFENGVFRPVTPVDLPEQCEVEVHVGELPHEPNPSDEGMDRIYELLRKPVDTGVVDLAARHDELDP